MILLIIQSLAAELLDPPWYILSFTDVGESGDGLQWSNGDLRLAGDGHSNTSGRLEIFIQEAYQEGVWGSVCADSFSLREATVACRQLGYQSALEWNYASETQYVDYAIGILSTRSVLINQQVDLCMKLVLIVSKKLVHVVFLPFRLVVCNPSVLMPLCILQKGLKSCINELLFL